MLHVVQFVPYEVVVGGLPTSFGSSVENLPQVPRALQPSFNVLLQLHVRLAWTCQPSSAYLDLTVPPASWSPHQLPLLAGYPARRLSVLAMFLPLVQTGRSASTKPRIALHRSEQEAE